MSDSKEIENLDDVVSILDVLQEEEDMEKEYYAVLGAGDSKCCTYPKGYIKRQPLYACLTCIPESRDDPSKRAGVCLACYYKCHEGHDVVELYTKRNFRCDCGNSKFANATQKSCKLVSEKDAVNQNNLYNQNYSGLYCICHRPYPDLDETIEDTMIQCCLCEDWLHERHLDSVVPANYDEMICNECMEKNDFLRLYFELMVEVGDKKEEKSGDNSKIDIDTVSDEPDAKKAKLENSACKKPADVESTYTSGASFWKDEWRNMLCQCAACIDMYKTLNLEFVLDSDDPVKVYEEKGTESLKSGSSMYERGMEALATLDRTQQVHLLSEFNNMQEKLTEFLADFARSNTVVTRTDIEQFFQKLKSEKNSPPPHFCR